MGRAQSLVANGCLFPGPFFPSPQHYSAGVRVYFGAVCFFSFKKKSLCVCILFLFQFFFDLHSLEDGMLGSEALKGRAQGTAS